jgi:cellulose synthase/poly-beta-1,6-N-acetylglucosamine synthase-like glycosyltransferase
MSKRVRYTIETLLVNALILSTLYQLIVYLANRRFWRQPPAEPVDEVPSISVVVPLRGKTLDTLALLTVMANTGPTDDYEVLAVLEGEDDPAYAVAREVQDAFPAQVRLVLSGPAGSHVGKIHLLNAGYEAARGTYVAFVDANVHVKAELWHAALAAMADPAVGAVFGPPLAAEPERRGSSAMATGGEVLAALHINHARSAGVPFAALNNRVNTLAGGFILMRREALENAGGLLHLLDDAAVGTSLGRMLRENGYRLVALPVPAMVIPVAESFAEATNRILRRLTLSRAYHPAAFLAWPFTNPLTVGFMLGWITEREGRWWGRQTWWFFVWLRMAIAFELDRIRFGRGFHWTAYAQLFMLDTFIFPALWARALFQRSVNWGGPMYRVCQGGKALPFLSAPRD